MELSERGENIDNGAHMETCKSNSRYPSSEGVWGCRILGFSEAKNTR